MRRSSTLVILLLLVATALAGCTNNEATEPTPTTPGATTPTSTTSPTATTPTPTVTTPTVTTPTIPPTNVTPTVSAVFVTSLTDSVAANGTANVCWRVVGTGSIPHTAIHFDDESHPNATAFAEYDLGAVYPDNGPPTGVSYALPATFCATIANLTSTTYLRPHALAPGTSINTLGPEKVVLVDDAREITFVDFLEVFPANFSLPVCWEVTGLTGTSTHTAVHFDDESHPNATAFGDYDLGASYPGNFTAANVSVTLPGEFCASLPMPSSGVRYMRAHVILNGTHYLSEERNVYTAPRVSVSDGLPASAAANAMVEVCWRSEGLESVAHTALHWDTVSHPAATAFGEYAGGAVYPDNGPASGTTHELPGPFCAELTMPASGAIYFRPHTIYSGGQELGPEYSISVA